MSRNSFMELFHAVILGVCLDCGRSWDGLELESCFFCCFIEISLNSIHEMICFLKLGGLFDSSKFQKGCIKIVHLSWSSVNRPQDSPDRFARFHVEIAPKRWTSVEPIQWKSIKYKQAITFYFLRGFWAWEASVWVIQTVDLMPYNYNFFCFLK